MRFSAKSSSRQSGFGGSSTEGYCRSHQQELIHYSRGEISITNRKGLEALSCECYAIESADYLRLIT